MGSANISLFPLRPPSTIWCYLHRMVLFYVCDWGWKSLERTSEPLELPGLLTSRCFRNPLWDPWSEVSCQESSVLSSWHLHSWLGGDVSGEPLLQSLWPFLSGPTFHVQRAGWFGYCSWWPTFKVALHGGLQFINLSWKCSNACRLTSSTRKL